MANSNTPFGLQVVRGGGVYAFNSQGTLYSIPTSDSTHAYYMNDAVKAAASGDANGVPNVVICAGTDALRGTIQGILQPGMYPTASLVGTGPILVNNYVPATKAAPYYVIVDDDQSTIYMMQDDGITTANLVAASCNLNFSITVTAGSTTNSKSASVILSSSFATTSSLNMKAMGLAQLPGNAFGQYAKWNCKINLSELTGSFVGV